ncbi:putative elongation factor TypA-like SVR3, chloroplastic [Selaginella moellendorffii]|nr:putative elongation factor TypA-like SVR3, chloroplastic [Selaginella moellendorffii]|eukprot:XP_002989923.2 putative elongation factor TypA-like SVR3, chloroplastic [Selaginella moellendorffii]
MAMEIAATASRGLLQSTTTSSTGSISGSSRVLARFSEEKRLIVDKLELGALRKRSLQLNLRRIAPAPRCRVATTEESVQVKDAPKKLDLRTDIRNLAIIAHVDHGKTTLVDGMLRQSKVFRDNQTVQERIMDSNDLERERGITILSKNTAITYKGTKINIIDTPGHSDFGGEVERVLNMVDGVLLLVDAVEGPMPQTRFVLKKALALGHRVIVVVNKVDRPAARPDYVINMTFELFLELEASDEQCDFQVIYASGLKGQAGLEPDALGNDLEPLFEAVLRCIPEPRVQIDAPLQMLITNLDYDEHKGRIGIGRVNAGTLTKGEVKICKPDEADRVGKVSEIFVFENFAKVPAVKVVAGDICAFAGINDVMIGETVADKANGVPLPSIKVEEPTVKMSFSVNTSPFSGQEGKFVTSRNLRDRLYRELERNLAMKVEDGETAETFIVSGRGTLHITILIENMRREGYEFMVGPPRVIHKVLNGKKLEPYEDAIVEVPEQYVGAAVDLLGKRRGQMLDMQASELGNTILKYRLPTRGLLGIRNSLLSASRGTAILNTVFHGYEEFVGDISTREQGSLVAFETGQTTSYALCSCQERGQLFLDPGVEVYKGQIVGIHQRPGDLSINVCKKKAATNIRSNKEQTVVLDAPQDFSLDDCVEYIEEDELVEVTPVSVRMCKNPRMARRGGR